MNLVVLILEVKGWEKKVPSHLWGQLAAGKAVPLQRTWLAAGGSSCFIAIRRADIFP